MCLTGGHYALWKVWWLIQYDVHPSNMQIACHIILKEYDQTYSASWICWFSSFMTKNRDEILLVPAFKL